MEFKELLTELEKFKDTDDYKSYVGGLVTSDRVTTYLDSEDGKKLLQPILDKYHSKGLDSWKTNNLQKLIDEEVKKRFPDADPKDVKLQELQGEIERIKREATRKDLTNKALKYATDKKLPVELIDYFIGEDEDGTTNNLQSLEKVFNASIQKVKEDYISNNRHNPDDDNGKKEPLTGVEEAFYKSNPNLKK